MYNTYRLQCDICFISFFYQQSVLDKFDFEFKFGANYFNHIYYKKMHSNRTRLDSQSEQEEQSHSFNCDCINCQNQRGNLPLLVEVIEKQKEIATSAIQPSEPQPSTSQQEAPKSNRKQLKCTHCEKIFTHKGDYNKHLRKHTGVQPFKCNVCDRKFALTSNLQRHLRIHSGCRPFLCEKCNKRFSRKDKLDAHLKSRFCRGKSKKD